jgi:hypothetical protein
MTHFTVGIIVAKDESSVESFIAEQMDPYYEHDEAEPYVCYSVEEAAADLAGVIHRLELILSRKESFYDLAKCRENLGRLRAMTPAQKYLEFIQSHERFNAQGEPVSTYNPKSKWDWYVIGGRWDGRINGRETDREAVGHNKATIEEAMKRGIVPHAIITPDGEWHECGRLGWWGILITENENWEAQVREILAAYPGYDLVIVDAHI